MLLLVLQLRKGISIFYTMFVCSVRLQTFFDHYKLFSTAIYYLWRPYTTLDGYILLTAAIYYFRRLYITFDGYILLLALPDCDFVRIQDFITTSCTYGLKPRLDFNINISLNAVLLFLQFNGFFYKFQCSLLEILFSQKYSPCTSNVSEDKQVSQQYI